MEIETGRRWLSTHCIPWKQPGLLSRTRWPRLGYTIDSPMTPLGGTAPGPLTHSLRGLSAPQSGGGGGVWQGKRGSRSSWIKSTVAKSPLGGSLATRTGRVRTCSPASSALGSGTLPGHAASRGTGRGAGRVCVCVGGVSCKVARASGERGCWFSSPLQTGRREVGATPTHRASSPPQQREHGPRC